MPIRIASTVFLALYILLAPAHAQGYLVQRPEHAGFTPYLANTAGPFRSEYLRAARRWPTALACLTPAQRSNPKPDFTQIQWTAIRSRLDAEACIFRVFEALGDPQQVQRWMRNLHLQDIRTRNLPQQQIELCGTNTPSQTGRVLVQSDQVASTVSQYLYGGETFCARFARNGTLLSTSYLVKGAGDYPEKTQASARQC